MADLQAQLKILGDAYATQLPEKLQQIEQAWAELPPTGWDENGFESLHRMVHSLAGSGKTFGFSLLGDAARALEQYLKPLVQEKKELSDSQRNRIQELMRELRQAQHRDPAPDTLTNA